MKPEPPFNPDQSDALRKLRSRWIAALLTNAPLPFVALPITGSRWIEQPPPDSATQAMLIAALIAFGALAAGLYARNQAYKAHWRADVVEPAGYVKGNTLLFGAINGAAFALFVISITTGYPAPTFAAAPVFIGLLAMNFPNGRPMKPTPPRIDDDGDLR